jgi:hypothetical protein
MAPQGGLRVPLDFIPFTVPVFPSRLGPAAPVKPQTSAKFRRT